MVSFGNALALGAGGSGAVGGGAIGGGAVACACIGFTLIEPSSSLVWSLSLELTIRLGSLLGRSLTSAFRMLTTSSLRVLVRLCSSAL